MNEPNLGLDSRVEIVATPPDTLLDRAPLRLELNVLEQPTVLELAVAFRKKIQSQYEQAEEAVLDAELNVANAQRIAIASRSRVAAFAAQLESLDKQIALL